MFLRKLVLSLGVWYVHFPHVALLRLLGPGPAILLTRITSFGQWLLTLAGANRRVLKAMREVVPEIRPDLRVGTVLRKHLQMKQQYFVEWKLVPTTRGRRFARRICENMEGLEHLEAALRLGRGVILTGPHFGMGRMNNIALLHHGYRTYTHQLSAVRYAGRTYAFVAEAVLRREVEDEKAADQLVVHHKPGTTFKTLVDLLGKKSIVVVIADGMAAGRFVELPFLNGVMAFPTGVARLAAKTGAPIVCHFGLLEGLTRHRFVLHPPIYCRDDSPVSIEATMRAYVALFEEYVRRYPWAWWNWRRLQVASGTGGRKRFLFVEKPTKETRYYTGEQA